MPGASEKVRGAGSRTEEERGGKHGAPQGPGAEERHDLRPGEHYKGAGEEVSRGAEDEEPQVDCSVRRARTAS